LNLEAARVSVDHVSAWSRQTGFESRVEYMFDDNLDTFWMPIEVYFWIFIVCVI